MSVVGRPVAGSFVVVSDFEGASYGQQTCENDEGTHDDQYRFQSLSDEAWLYSHRGVPDEYSENQNSMSANQEPNRF